MTVTDQEWTAHRVQRMRDVAAEAKVEVQCTQLSGETVYVFHNDGHQIGNPAIGIVQAELVAFALRDFATAANRPPIQPD